MTDRLQASCCWLHSAMHGVWESRETLPRWHQGSRKTGKRRDKKRPRNKMKPLLDVQLSWGTLKAFQVSKYDKCQTFYVSAKRAGVILHRCNASSPYRWAGSVLQVLHKHRNTYPVINALQLYQVQSHQSLYWYRYLANDAVGIKGLSANTNELWALFLS